MVEWAVVETVEDLCRVEGQGEWAVVDPLEETCSSGLGTGSAPMLAVETRTLLGGWNVTSVRHPDLKVLDLHPSLQVVSEAGAVPGECVVDGEWTGVAQEALEDPEVSVEEEEETAVALEVGVEWTEVDLEAGDGVAHPWMIWGEGGGEWAHQAKWT